jgi:hypothetical protein
MHPRRASTLAWFFTALLLVSLGFPRSSAAEERGTTVAIVELDSTPPGYAVVIAGTRYRGLLKMLNGLATDYTQGDQLAVLFASDVPLEAIATLASMASKVGYFGDTLKLFVLDSKREGMLELSLGKDWAAFSADAQAMAERFRSH